jgi:type IX secretion system PorP/SprF family membrane protein
MKYFLACLCLIAALPYTYAQQGYTYTQYIKNPTPFNHAYSLINGQGNIDALSHNQWVGIDGAPTTLFFNGSIPINKFNGSAGLVIIHDKVAVERQTGFSAFIAKAVQLSDQNYFGVSVSAGAESFKGNYSQLSATDVAFRNDVSQTSAVAGVSLMLYDPNKYYFGVSVPAVKLKKQNNRYDSPAFYFTGAYLQSINEDMKIKPALLVTYMNNTPVVANASAMLYLKDQFGFGAGYSTTKAVAGMVSYVFSNNISITYSYQTLVAA